MICTRLALSTITVLVVAGCTSTAGVDPDVALASLRDAADAYHRAASAKDAGAVVTFYATDALMAPPNANRVEGIDNIRNYRFGFIETPGVELRFQIVRAEVSPDGEMGWTLAIGDITINRPEGPPGRDRVRDFHTWRKQEDGSWKIVVDIWNSEPLESTSGV